MSHRDKSPRFIYHCVVCIEIVSAYTHCWLIRDRPTYLKCNASRNPLLFRSKPISFRGITLSQLDKPCFLVIVPLLFVRKVMQFQKGLSISVSLSASDLIFFTSSSSGNCHFCAIIWRAKGAMILFEAS